MLLQTVQRLHASGRYTRALRDEIRPAGRADGVPLRIRRLLRVGGDHWKAQGARKRQGRQPHRPKTGFFIQNYRPKGRKFSHRYLPPRKNFPEYAETWQTKEITQAGQSETTPQVYLLLF
ncbi:hypothetical protein [Rhizobium sp. 21-4511-3d]